MTQHRRTTSALAGLAATVVALSLAGAPASAAPPPSPAATQTQQKAHLSQLAHQVGQGATPADRARLMSQAASQLPREVKAYGVQGLWNKGITGLGTSVATIVSFGDPDIKSVIDTFDASHGLPPADVETLTPAGPLPTCNDQTAPTNGCRDWIGETDLDVMMIHLMAPQAKIIVAATPVNETQGLVGLPEMMTAIDYLVRKKLAQVISMSLSATEDTFTPINAMKTLDPTLRRAKLAGVPVVAATGDCGATSNTVNSAYQCQDVYPFRAVGWPASDPLVTAIGGTVLHLDSTGARTTPDTVWPETGGGLSKVFQRPAFQAGVKKIIGGNQRSIPDISMEGISGTSQATPLFAGVLALATQSNHGKPLGDLNRKLYQLGPKGLKAGIVDVTTGNNNYGDVPGFAATPGFDVVSGWGTIDAAIFVPALLKQH
ncbi:S53 family peptidase [Fodinicola feengrottensis]|uniref:Peptidase S53 domain-containing protein n=1 Tax=Fodinicola feengrottensis TaxID=435914 RepID=A0ABN2J516_9ACTN|nr:S53 family peptidase [Fodinicola feengrottensis]